jgi:methylase of polypeptide subunit release factors
MSEQSPQYQIDRLRAFFRDCGYTERGVQELLGSSTPPPLQARPKAMYLTRDHSVLNVLLRLFFINEPVASEVTRTSLPEWLVDFCIETELLKDEGEDSVANVVLVPIADYLFASDVLITSRVSSSDFVLPASSPTTRYLLNFTLRRPVRTALDLGTGCGILAHVASEFSDHVVATDINPHASEYAEFNARLNGLENLEVRTGDLFEPVEDQRFDLILANPPFVLAPSKEWVFRDNDMVLDDFCGMLARTAPDYLEVGGRFQMICEWVETGDEPWHERLGRWFEDSGCDVWVLHGSPEDPGNYAQVRIAEASVGAITENISDFSEWRDYYRDNGVTAIHSGIVTMRKREGTNWIRIQPLHSRVQEAVHDARGAVYNALENGFDVRDYLDALAGVDELLGLTPRLSADTNLMQSYERADDRWLLRKQRMSLETGLMDEIELDQGAFEFLSLFDGTRTIEACIKLLAGMLGEPITKTQDKFLPLVRALIERGFLTLP